MDIVERLSKEHWHITGLDLEDAIAEIESLRAQLSEAQQDAARYRWLREGRMEFGNQDGADASTFWWVVDFEPEEADALIDAAMKEEK